ncbi:IQ domain-containing protein M [Balaenoptera ricei]|uniref:IQ domain-containing protein M n=1 Tax=Balaenoptera ricei TaxID=2746895 RepID=UPI0028BD355D|nr:IQ domain-containing protein M [Balaenoptera ricei]
MAAEAGPDQAESRILEIPKQDFSQEAKTLIAQHYKKINENKVPGTSINVFRNKHQKPKSSKFIPLEIKKKETLDMVQELQAAYKMICFPKDCSKSGHSEEAPSRTSFKEPHIFNVKKKYKGSIDLTVKEQVKLGKIVTNIDSVSKKMEKEKQQHHAKTRMVDSFCAFPIINLGLHLRPMTSSSMGLLKENEKFYQKRTTVCQARIKATTQAQLIQHVQVMSSGCALLSFILNLCLPLFGLKTSYYRLFLHVEFITPVSDFLLLPGYLHWDIP